MTKPNSGKSAINKHMNKIQNTKDEPCYSDGRGQFGHSFYEGEDKCMYCGKSRTTTTDKPMNQIDKLKEEFDKEFGPKTIWVVPSKENIETIKDIWSWIIQNFTPKEEVKKIDMKNKTMNKSSEGKKDYSKEFTDQDVVYMCETILAYLDMGMVDRAKQHLENLQRWFIYLPTEGELLKVKQSK